jgi:hypothetical protein
LGDITTRVWFELPEVRTSRRAFPPADADAVNTEPPRDLPGLKAILKNRDGTQVLLLQEICTIG